MRIETVPCYTCIVRFTCDGENSEECDKINWEMLSGYQTLSEDFIREFEDKVDWFEISIHQKLSEDFIREFEDRVYWYYIFKHQKSAEHLREEFKDRIVWEEDEDEEYRKVEIVFM